MQKAKQTQEEQSQCINFMVQLWPEWGSKLNDAIKATWREIFLFHSVRAVITTLQRHRNEQPEGRDYSPNNRKVLELLSLYQNIQTASPNRVEINEVWWHLSRPVQAIVRAEYASRALTANRFEKDDERDRAERDLRADRRLWGLLQSREPESRLAEWEAEASRAIAEIDSISAGARRASAAGN